MSLARFVTLSSVFLGLAEVGRAQQPAQQPSWSPLTERPEPPSTICGDIIDQVNNGMYFFSALEAFQCLISVPFDAAVASRYVDYYDTIITFHSTLSYLKTPPAGYQQPAIDVRHELDIIKRNITENYYANQYSFEIALQSVVFRMHDAHVDLNAGVLSAFVFASPVDLVTASKDGKELPQIYIRSDMKAVRNKSLGPNDISSIVTINGRAAEHYLSDLAALQSVGMLEPHADWNAMMGSPARDLQGSLGIFDGGMTFYPGNELNFTFANGTLFDTQYTAFYYEREFTGPLTTGGDFYNYFVLGLLPASYSEVPLPMPFNLSDSDSGSDDDDDDNDNNLSPHTLSSAYPEKPDVIQSNLGGSPAGFVTGYFFDDIKTGVLSIPSFDQAYWDLDNFSLAVDDFIGGAQSHKLDKIVIDLEQNPGGLVEFAFATFGKFFPDRLPFAGSRMRSHEQANAIGQSFNDYWQGLPIGREDKMDLLSSEWVVLARLNADTGNNFTSWAEYYGPRHFHNDNFSLTERYDVANAMWDDANFDDWVPNEHTNETSPFSADQITILTDGVCSSTCSLFVEMLVAVGVRTVVVGGRPEAGPMQAVGGTRGARWYSASDIDLDFQKARNWSDDAASVLPAELDEAIYTNYATFNLRDQIRDRDESGTPLQFQYLPADCRLYYTFDNVYNMTALWRDVSHAAFVDHTLCIDGWRTATFPTPPDSTKAHAVMPDLSNLHDWPAATNHKTSSDPLTDVMRPKMSQIGKPCKEGSGCSWSCLPFTLDNCGNQRQQNICATSCDIRKSNCGPTLQCKARNPAEQRQSSGHCIPKGCLTG